jgi:hypothetical protein
MPSPEHLVPAAASSFWYRSFDSASQDGSFLDLSSITSVFDKTSSISEDEW